MSSDQIFFDYESLGELRSAGVEDVENILTFRRLIVMNYLWAQTRCRLYHGLPHFAA
jgi:hypothetical protein